MALWCGRSHAPTRMCDWDTLASRPEDEGYLRWRDRCAVRRCAESLVAREAHLLSNIDALELRIAEAEAEDGDGPPGVGNFTRALSACSLPILLLLFTAVMRRWRQGEQDGFTWTTTGSLLEAILWLSVLLRACNCLQAVLQTAGSCWAWGASNVRCSEDGAGFEADALRQQVGILHQGLAETQHLLCRLEDQLDRLQIHVERCRSPHAGGLVHKARILLVACVDRWWVEPSAMRVLLLGWLCSVIVASRLVLAQSARHTF
eukprot:TRINITY_DN34335_c0_g1_i1.p1 TRINITY_DN34335_c0_g1~~TRINITY_DN34335_c0_g1_i1.p1  ORF type:complete len:261 (-),score=35.73 TRINITY_DN34335_c0_g1_i1:23-805(-)